MDGALEMVYRDDPWIIGKHFTNADNTDFGIAGCVGDSDRNNSCFNIKTGFIFIGQLRFFGNIEFQRNLNFVEGAGWGLNSTASG